jgi:hypothetical protein
MLSLKSFDTLSSTASSYSQVRPSPDEAVLGYPAVAAVAVRRLEVLQLLVVEQRELLCAVVVLVAAEQELQCVVVAAERELLCAVVAAEQGPVLAVEQPVVVMSMARSRRQMEMEQPVVVMVMARIKTQMEKKLPITMQVCSGTVHVLDDQHARTGHMPACKFVHMVLLVNFQWIMCIVLKILLEPK